MATHRTRVFAVLLMLGAAAHAQQPDAVAESPRTPSASAPATAALAWDSLTPAQQQVLAPLHQNWQKLSPDEQQRMQRGATRWTQMTPQQRDSAQQRFQHWNALTPEQRAAIRERYQRFSQLPAPQQRRLRETYQRFSALPPEQRQQLRARWDHLTPQERQAALASAHAGATQGSHLETLRKPAPALLPKPKAAVRAHPAPARGEHP